MAKEEPQARSGVVRTTRQLMARGRWLRRRMADLHVREQATKAQARAVRESSARARRESQAARQARAGSRERSGPDGRSGQDQQDRGRPGL